MYSSVDIFGEKEKDWKTHVAELWDFSDNLHALFCIAFWRNI
jgi:hypothetical protein